MRRLLLLLALSVLAAGPALATPVSISVEPWMTSDGNFRFSAIHSANSGLMLRGGDRFYAGGAITYEVAQPVQFLSGDLTAGVLTIDPGSLQLDGGAQLAIDRSVLDFNVGAGDLIGELGYTLTDGGTVEVGSFYFFNHDFTNGFCDANDLCSTPGGDSVYRLWGNNWDNAAAGSSRPWWNVMRNGQERTRWRGIDLGGTIRTQPIPEPGSAFLFACGALLVGAATRRGF